MLESFDKTYDKKVVIIGAGPAGLTAAYQLSKNNVKSTIIEKDQILGGISRTVNYNGYYFDIGGHRFFTKIKEVEDIWQDILSDDFLICKRLSRIYYNKKFFYYPFRPFNALLGLGIWNSFLILVSFFYAKFFSLFSPAKKEETFEHWVSNRFGKRFFNIFFRTYTEKVWGIPCNEIRAEWASQRIKGLSLVTAIKNTFLVSQNNKTVIKTLIGEFKYPKLGPGMMWKAVSDRIKSKGSKVCLGTEVVGLRWSEGRIEAIEACRNGKIEVIYGDHFISSMPLREAIQKFKPSVPKEVLNAANKLRYRDFLTVALIINKPDVFPDNWIYIHDPDVLVGRIQNFKNWSPYMVPDQGKTCLGLEYFCYEGDSFWSMSDDHLIEFGKQELIKLGFLSPGDIGDGTVVRMPKAYPVYDSVYKGSINTIRKFLNEIQNLQLIGRNGQHKYNNQDHSMLTGMMAAENLLGANHDLWKVNEEWEYHEELSKKTSRETALEKLIAASLARIDKLGFATALGTVLGLLFFFATFVMLFKDVKFVNTYQQLVSQYLFGYTVSLKGAFIGMAYGFSWAFLFGWLFAYIRNLFTALFIYRIKRNVDFLKFRDFLDNF